MPNDQQWLTGSDYRLLRGEHRPGNRVSMSEDRLLNECERLLELLTEAKNLLAVMEYQSTNVGLLHRCPLCGGEEPPIHRDPITGEGHRQECKLAHALIEARACLEAAEKGR